MNLKNLRMHLWDYTRGALRGHLGARIGRRVKLTGPGTYDLQRGSTITDGVRIWVGPGATLTMASGAKLGDRCVVNVETGVTLRENVRVSWDVQILDTDFHWIRGEGGALGAHTRAVEIGPDVLIGARSMILKGVRIGRGSIVGAGSVVRKTVEPGAIVIGNPAQRVGSVTEWGSARTRPPSDVA